MERIKRNERLSAITQILTETPNQIHTFSEFCEMFGSAKSTISEDIDMISKAVSNFDLGKVETVAGAAGGVYYRHIAGADRTKKILEKLSEKLSEPGRVLPGGFLYTSDISCEPQIAEKLGMILAARYYDKWPDFVLTMETKGIPIALMTARMLNVPLVIARYDSRAYEGSAVKINYIAGGSDRGGNERIETMALSRRAVQAGQRALIIDDFMKGGGTLKGMMDMMAEFQAEVVGVGVMISTAEPAVKRVEGVNSLLVLKQIDHTSNRAVVVPAKEYMG